MAGARKKDYCFTVHAGHFGDDYHTEQDAIDRLKLTDCVYIVFQPEDGGQLGRPHLQGYVMFKSLKTLVGAQTALGINCHVEHRQAPKISDAVEYCKKDDTRRLGTTWWEKGVQPMDQGKKRTLQDAIDVAKTKGFKRAMLELPEVTIRYAKGLREYAHIAAGESIPRQRPVKVYYIWGDSGCGKSFWANTLFDSSDNTYTTTDMPDKIWMGNYSGERTLVIEEFKSLCNDSILKCMLEGYKMEFQNKGGFVWAQWDTVILTSNVDPTLAYDPQINWWSVLPTPPGPFQRRFATGGIIHGTGNFEMGTAQFDTPLPLRNAVPNDILPHPDPVPAEYVAPDSAAAPDDPAINLTMTDVPGAAPVEPTTPNTAQLIQSMTGLDVDEFLYF